MDHTLFGRLWHRREQSGAEPVRTLLGPVGAASLAIKYYVVYQAKAGRPALPDLYYYPCRGRAMVVGIVNCARPLADA